MTTCNSCRFAIFKNSALWCNVHNQKTPKDATCNSHKPEDPPEELPPVNPQYPGTWVRIPDQEACLAIIKDYLRQTNTTQYRLRKQAGISKSLMTYIMNRQRPLTTDSATKLFNVMAGKQ